MPNHRSLSPILGFDVSFGILPRKDVVCRDFNLRAIATFWVMSLVSLVGIYPGRVSSQASPFFEKLLNGDMRESKEELVRLEMVIERGLKDILEFIYSGSVQTSTEENAQELIAMADYFLLPQLKAFAERIFVQNLTQKVNVLNCISTYHFAEIYRCRELLPATENFIFANFTTVTKTEEFLNVSSKEVEVWISSDEINVSAEEDVFIILIIIIIFNLYTGGSTH